MVRAVSAYPFVVTHPDLSELSRHPFAPVIALPSNYEVYDFTRGYDPNRTLQTPYGIGRYNERRLGMYESELFSPGTSDVRNIHLGIDLGAPVGTKIHAFYDGIVYLVGINPAPGDYGGTLITEHHVGELVLWALHGHLSHGSIADRRPGQSVRMGEVIARIGDRHENGGWNPHLHFQLSLRRPERCDLPGTASQRDIDAALAIYPDPRLVLGPLY